MYKVFNTNRNYLGIVKRQLNDRLALKQSKLNKYFCSNSEKHEKENIADENKESEVVQKNVYVDIANMSYSKLKEKYDSIDENLDEDVNTYNVQTLPDPNHFGEAILFYCPHTILMHSVRAKVELSSIPFFSVITFLSFKNIMFTSSPFLPYLLGFTTFISCLRYFLDQIYPRSKAIYQMTLVNEHQIKIYYEDGISEVVEIKNISLSSKTHGYFKMFEEAKAHTDAARKMVTKNINLILNVNNKQDALMIFKFHGNDISYAELNLLLGIFNKKTHRLSI